MAPAEIQASNCRCCHSIHFESNERQTHLQRQRQVSRGTFSVRLHQAPHNCTSSCRRPSPLAPSRLPILHRLVRTRRPINWRSAPALRRTTLRRIRPLRLQRHPLSSAAFHLLHILPVLERLCEPADAACDVLVAVNRERDDRLPPSVSGEVKREEEGRHATKQNVNHGFDLTTVAL